VRFLTPTLGPNSSATATRDRPICRTDALPTARPTCDVGGVRRELEHLTAVHERVEYRARPFVTSTATVTVVGVRRGACRAAVLMESPQITRASRQ
jgi:hypothetical protein